jgi:hypothetical protein
MVVAPICCCTVQHIRGDPRRFRERAPLRPYVMASRVDEVALAGAVKPLLSNMDRVLRSKLAKGQAHGEAVLECSRAFQEAFQNMCLAALLDRDRRIVRLAESNGADALQALKQLGLLEPPWRAWRRGQERHVVHELAGAPANTHIMAARACSCALAPNCLLSQS